MIDMVEYRGGWLKIYSDDPNAYGLRVRGDSMWPRIQSGEFVLIEPVPQYILVMKFLFVPQTATT